MKTRFIDITEEQKRTKSSRKVKLIVVGVLLECDGDNKKKLNGKCLFIVFMKKLCGKLTLSIC